MIFRSFDVSGKEYAQALRLREDVLRKPLHLVLTPDELVRDAGCFHLGGFDGTELKAVLLLQPVDEHTVQMRQVAVLPSLQGTGIGTQLIAFAERFARQQGCTLLIAHARNTALGFYLRLGYEASGEEFTEQTIPHRLVTKVL